MWAEVDFPKLYQHCNFKNNFLAKAIELADQIHDFVAKIDDPRVKSQMYQCREFYWKVNKEYICFVNILYKVLNLDKDHVYIMKDDNDRYIMDLEYGEREGVRVCLEAHFPLKKMIISISKKFPQPIYMRNFKEYYKQILDGKSLCIDMNYYHNRRMLEEAHILKVMFPEKYAIVSKIKVCNTDQLFNDLDDIQQTERMEQLFKNLDDIQQKEQTEQL